MQDQIDELKKELKKVKHGLEKEEQVMQDLIDYLQRTDGNFTRDNAKFENWVSRLDDMRGEDKRIADERKAKRLLENSGYIVLRDASELDAVKLKHWVTSEEEEDGKLES